MSASRLTPAGATGNGSRYERSATVEQQQQQQPTHGLALLTNESEWWSVTSYPVHHFVLLPLRAELC
jgi:hypothetical protein